MKSNRISAFKVGLTVQKLHEIIITITVCKHIDSFFTDREQSVESSNAAVSDGLLINQGVIQRNMLGQQLFISVRVSFGHQM